MSILVRACVIYAAIAFPLSGLAQVTLANPEVEAAAEDPRIAAVIAQAERVDRALTTDDRSAFAAVMASDLVVNNPQNVISRPGDAIARNAAGKISYSVYERSIEYAAMRDRYVLLMGEEVVVRKGTTTRVSRRFTDLWEPIGDRWLLSARQATIIDRP